MCEASGIRRPILSPRDGAYLTTYMDHLACSKQSCTIHTLPQVTMRRECHQRFTWRRAFRWDAVHFLERGPTAPTVRMGGVQIGGQSSVYWLGLNEDAPGGSVG